MAYDPQDALLPAQAAAGATLVTVIDVVPTNLVQASWTVEKLSLTSPSLVTGVATNNVTFNFRQLRGGSVLNTLGTLTLGSGTNLPAEQEVNVPINYSGPLADGDVIDVQMVQNGTGLAVPANVNAKVELA